MDLVRPEGYFALRAAGTWPDNHGRPALNTIASFEKRNERKYRSPFSIITMLVSCRETIQKLFRNSGWDVFPHPPYSPDLVPFDQNLQLEKEKPLFCYRNKRAINV